MRNTIAASGIERCIFVVDKGFYSKSNIGDIEQATLQYITPLRRNNKTIPYEELSAIDQSESNFAYARRHIFFMPIR